MVWTDKKKSWFFKEPRFFLLQSSSYFLGCINYLDEYLITISPSSGLRPASPLKGEAVACVKLAYLTASPSRGEAGRSPDEGGIRHCYNRLPRKSKIFSQWQHAGKFDVQYSRVDFSLPLTFSTFNFPLKNQCAILHRNNFTHL